ncbi:MAG: type II secretion system protein [Fimbriimonadales bacterium]
MIRAFTLIEMIIVMAITAILITLIGIPLVQGLNLTRASQAFAEAQDISREVIGRINKELSTAALVVDNSVPESAVEVVLPLRGNANPGYVRLHNAKIDFVPPAQGDPTNPQVNPGRNRIDPTLKSAIGQVILPVAPGQKMIRYWVGLRRPVDANGDRSIYVNPWVPKMTGAIDGNENLYVLYRAEVLPYVWNQTLGRYVPNTDLFAVDPANGQAIINDPGFFEHTPSVFLDNANAHRARLANWVREARLVVQDSRTDMIMPEVDETTGDLIYQPYVGGGTIPKVRSLVNFQAVRVSSEPAKANRTQRLGEEVVDNARLAPEFFQTEMPGWTTDTLARIYRLDPRQTPRPPYYIARWRQPVGTPNYLNEIVYFDPQNDVSEYVDGRPIFNISGYQATASAGNPRIGTNIYPAGGIAPELMIFTMDQRRGRVQMRFPARAALGYDPTPPTSVPNGTLTGWLNSPTRAQYDPSGVLGRRFVDLRNTTLFPGSQPDFNPFQPTVAGYANPHSKITPGSEIVIGPDQRPGPNFGLPIRYSRVAATEGVGLNQYRINYTDLRPPNWNTYGVPDPNTNADVRNFIEPRFKKGYVEFHSDPTLVLPPGNIVMPFDFQVNQPADAVVVDYDSNQQIRVDLTIRRFSGGYTVAPQTVTVSDVVAIRNFAR